jgi:hypothetical protein
MSGSKQFLVDDASYVSSTSGNKNLHVRSPYRLLYEGDLPVAAIRMRRFGQHNIIEKSICNR